MIPFHLFASFKCLIALYCMACAHSNIKTCEVTAQNLKLLLLHNLQIKESVLFLLHTNTNLIFSIYQTLFSQKQMRGKYSESESSCRAKLAYNATNTATSSTLITLDENNSAEFSCESENDAPCRRPVEKHKGIQIYVIERALIKAFFSQYLF